MHKNLFYSREKIPCGGYVAVEQKDLAFDDSSFNSARIKFFSESVSTTSIYLAKVSTSTHMIKYSLYHLSVK